VRARNARNSHLALALHRGLEVIKDQDEDKQVVYAQALLQEVAGKKLLSLCGPQGAPYGQAKREGPTHIYGHVLALELHPLFRLQRVAGVSWQLVPDRRSAPLSVPPPPSMSMIYPNALHIVWKNVVQESNEVCCRSMLLPSLANFQTLLCRDSSGIGSVHLQMT